MKIKSFEVVKAEVRKHLKEYLALRGRKVEGLSCQCPNGVDHKNDDQHMSCGIDREGVVWHCNSCDSKGDIFSAANYLENKPLVGEEFVTENFMYLAKLFNISYELEEISEEEKVEQSVYLVYDRAKEMLKKEYALSKPVQEYVKKRGWDKMSDFEFGYCESYDKFIGTLEKEFDKAILLKAGLYHKDLFTERLLIPIRDVSGRVCAFGARSIEDKGRYVNSKNSLVYDKSNTLFNLNNARKVSTTVYVVEGFADCITLYKHGMQNAVAVGGTSFTQKQYELLVRNRFKKIVLCFDNDEAGRQALDKALLKVIGNKKDLLVYIKEISGEKDPDEFVNKQGIAKFQAIPELTIFEWRLNKFVQSQTDELKNQVLEDIVNEPSFIERDRMCDKMSKETGIRLETVQKEVGRLEIIKQEKLDITTTEIIKEESEFETKINEYEEWVFSRDSELLGMSCGYKRMTEALDGIQNGLYLVGGRPNVGKTSFNLNLAYNLAGHNADAFVLFWSIDDNLKKVIPRLLAMECGLPINAVSNPMFKLTQANGYSTAEIKEKLELREQAVEKLKGMAKRFLVKDISSGGTIEAIEKSVMTCRALTKSENMRLILFIDNFHKLQADRFGTEARQKFTHLSEQIKRISNVYDCPVITTVELRKSENIRPVEDDIKETVDLVYDADCIMLVHNEVHRVGDNESKIFFVDQDGNKRPVLEVEVAKNKTSGFKGHLFFRFFQDSCKIVECDSFESRNLRNIILGLPENKQPQQIPNWQG